MLFAFFWVVPRRLNFMCRRFWTHCPIFIGRVLFRTTYENVTVDQSTRRNTTDYEPWNCTTVGTSYPARYWFWVLLWWFWIMNSIEVHISGLEPPLGHSLGSFNCEGTERSLSEGRYTLSVKLNDFTVWRQTWRKNWVNCAVLTGNSPGLRNVLSSRLSHRELRSSLRESHSSLSLPADTTMASSQGTSVSSKSFSRWTSHDIFLFKYHFLLHILRFLFFFSDNIMVHVASKQQMTSLFLSSTVTRTRRHTELTKTDKTDGKTVLCSRIDILPTVYLCVLYLSENKQRLVPLTA